MRAGTERNYCVFKFVATDMLIYFIPFNQIILNQLFIYPFISEMPFGSMPVLIVDDVMIPQSSAIERYVARTCGKVLTSLQKTSP